MLLRHSLRVLFLVPTLLTATAGLAQQVVQRGAFGTPASVFDETQTWSTPLLVASAKEVEIYIPDVSTPEWLRMNYSDYLNKGTYSLSLFTFYKTPEACRANQADGDLRMPRISMRVSISGTGCARRWSIRSRRRSL